MFRIKSQSPIRFQDMTLEQGRCLINDLLEMAFPDFVPEWISCLPRMMVDQPISSFLPSSETSGSVPSLRAIAVLIEEGRGEGVVMQVMAHFESPHNRFLMVPMYCIKTFASGDSIGQQAVFLSEQLSDFAHFGDLPVSLYCFRSLLKRAGCSSGCDLMRFGQIPSGLRITYESGSVSVIDAHSGDEVWRIEDAGGWDGWGKAVTASLRSMLDLHCDGRLVCEVVDLSAAPEAA